MPQDRLAAAWLASQHALQATGQRHTPDQQALGDLVRDVTNGGRKPLSGKDADTILDWGRESGLGVRDDRNADHWTGERHIHVPGSGIGHVPVQRCEAK